MHSPPYPYGTPRAHEPRLGPVVQPLHRATAYALEDAQEIGEHCRGERHGDFYPRLGHHNGVEFESLIAAYEGAEGAVAFSSGMAAMSAAILGTCGQGDRVLIADHIYGGTATFAKADLPRFCIEVDRFDSLSPASLREALRRPARLVVLESPINPSLRLVDLAASAAACHEAGALCLVDGTFAPPPFQRALDHGVDLLVHSATKFYGGHSDVLAGVVLGRHDRLAPIVAFRSRTGGVLAPDPAWLLCRSMPTLPVRLAAQRVAAETIAAALNARAVEDPVLTAVLHPSLAGHPDHALWQRQMAGGPALLTFSVAGGLPAAEKLFSNLRVIARAPSLGGVESVASLPRLTTHANATPEELVRAGISDGMVRVSIGLEGADVLLDDLLAAIAGRR